MKFITIRDLRSKSRQIQDDLPKFREMVLTSNGRPIAILTAVSDDSLESSLMAIRRARATSAVISLQLQGVKSGKYKIRGREIDKEIREVRKRRAK